MTFGDDVAHFISEAQHRERKTFEQVVNEAVRRGLAETSPATQYRARAHHSGVRPGVGVTALNRLADDLEDDALLGSARCRSTRTWSLVVTRSGSM